MGMPLSTYRSQRRLERFLVEHDPRRGNLLSSSLAAGFGSYSQFHRVFTKLMGLSPRAWERREREQPQTIDRRPRGRRV
jgi:AraC-like DNA-binding protein